LTALHANTNAFSTIHTCKITQYKDIDLTRLSLNFYHVVQEQRYTGETKTAPGIF